MAHPKDLESFAPITRKTTLCVTSDTSLLTVEYSILSAKHRPQCEARNVWTPCGSALLLQVNSMRLHLPKYFA